LFLRGRLAYKDGWRVLCGVYVCICVQWVNVDMNNVLKIMILKIFCVCECFAVDVRWTGALTTSEDSRGDYTVALEGLPTARSASELTSSSFVAAQRHELICPGEQATMNLLCRPKPLIRVESIRSRQWITSKTV